VPLVIVKSEPEFVHEPALLNATGNPELAVAETVKVLLNTADAGACVVTVIVWFSLFQPRSLRRPIVTGPGSCIDEAEEMAYTINRLAVPVKVL